MFFIVSSLSLRWIVLFRGNIIGCVRFYLRDCLYVVEINPRIAPTRTSVPPRFPAIRPRISRMIAQVRLETYLEPAMHTMPTPIRKRALTVPPNNGRISRTRKNSAASPSRFNTPKIRMIIPPTSTRMRPVFESEDAMFFRLCFVFGEMFLGDSVYEVFAFCYFCISRSTCVHLIYGERL